jgi:hypothetical protein
MAESIEAEAVAAILKSAGLTLPHERVKNLLPAAARLREAAQWVAAHDVEWTEPALVFDSQEQESVADGR